MTFRYEVHVVSPEEYDITHLGQEFHGGVVVEGTGGLENDCLIVTAHDDEIPYQMTAYWDGLVWVK